MRIIKIIRANPEVELKGPHNISFWMFILNLPSTTVQYTKFLAGLDVYDHGEQAYPPSAYVDGWQVLHYCQYLWVQYFYDLTYIFK